MGLLLHCPLRVCVLLQHGRQSPGRQVLTLAAPPGSGSDHWVLAWSTHLVTCGIGRLWLWQLRFGVHLSPQQRGTVPNILRGTETRAPSQPLAASERFGTCKGGGAPVEAGGQIWPPCVFCVEKELELLVPEAGVNPLSQKVPPPRPTDLPAYTRGPQWAGGDGFAGLELED